MKPTFLDNRNNTACDGLSIRPGTGIIASAYIIEVPFE